MKFEIVEVQPGKFKLMLFKTFTRTEWVNNPKKVKWWHLGRIHDNLESRQVEDVHELVVSALTKRVIGWTKFDDKHYFPTAEAAEQCAREYADRVNNYPKTVKTFEI